MAGQRQSEWLRGEAEKWVRDGLLTEAQRIALLQRYPACRGGKAWGTILFSSLGAVIAGLGVILLLAHNWDVIGRIEKLAIVAGSVLATHITGLFFFRSTERERPLGEGICLFGSMLFGAGIWLVAQIYHIDEHYPNAFMVWGFGCLLMAVVMPSIPQAILGTILVTIWSVAERGEFGTPMLLAPFLVVGISGFMAYRYRSRLLLAVVIPAFYLTYGFVHPRGECTPWMVYLTIMSWSATMLALSYLVRRNGRFTESNLVLAVCGWLPYAGVLYVMAFPEASREIFDWERHAMGWMHFVYWLLPVLACLFFWGIVVRDWVSGNVERREGELGMEVFLIPLTVLLAMADLFYLRILGGWVVAGPFNLVLIVIAASLVASGCRYGLLRTTLLGTILMVLVIVTRYFDLFESLLVRGLVFVIMGGLLLAEGIVYSRARRQRATGDVS